MKPHDPLEDLLRRRNVPAAPAGGPLCGDPEVLAAYAENALDEAARDGLQAHLAVCNPCRESVVALVRSAPREAVPVAAAGASWWRWIWATPALALLALVFVMTRPVPAPVPASLGTRIMTAAKNEPPPSTRELYEPKRQRAEPAKRAPAAPVVPEAAASKAVDQLKAEATAPMAAAETQANAKALGGMNAVQARGPYANQQNNSGQNAYSFVQKSEASVPPAPAPAATPARDAAPASRVLARMSLPKSEIPVRIEKGVLSISIDAELTWQVVKTPEEAQSAKFTDPLNGELLSVSHVVYLTKDGGKTWVKQNAK